MAIVGSVFGLMALMVVATIANLDLSSEAEPTPRPTLPSSRRPTLPPTTPATTPPRTTPPPPSSTRPSPPGPSPTITTYNRYPAFMNSPLYRQQIKRDWSCAALADPEVPPWGTAYRRYADGAIDCMMALYGPLTRAAGVTLPRPGMTHIDYTKGGSTPCGDIDDRAPFYCTANQTIYADPAIVDRYDNAVRLGGVDVFFHEFAHHLQQQFDLIKGPYRAGLEERMQVSRRLELQASCFAWMALSTMQQPRWTAADDREFLRWAGNTNDEIHGNGASHTYWYLRGRGQTSMGVCNSWIAQNGRVQ